MININSVVLFIAVIRLHEHGPYLAGRSFNSRQP